MKSDLDFNKLFGRIRDIDQGKKVVKEAAVVECGMMNQPMGMSNIPSTPPVSMSVNLNAQGIDQIKSLLDLMHKADSPLAAGPVGGLGIQSSPMPSMAPPAPIGIPGGAMDMPKIGLDMPPAIKTSAGPGEPEEFGGEPMSGMDPLAALVKSAGLGAKPKGPEAETPEGPMGDEESGVKSPVGSAGDAPAPKGEMNKVADEVRGMADTLADENEGYENEPDEKYGDVGSVTATGNDMHSKGKEAPKVNGGGNPMETIRRQLDARYREIKEAKAKPDFLDVDKDKNKKEPFKKAVKDKAVKEGFPTVAAAKKDADAAGMKTGEKKKSSTGGTIEKTKSGVKHTAGKHYSGKGA